MDFWSSLRAAQASLQEAMAQLRHIRLPVEAVTSSSVLVWTIRCVLWRGNLYSVMTDSGCRLSL